MHQNNSCAMMVATIVDTVTKRNPHIVCVYEYEPDSTLNIKCFPEMTDEWLDFVEIKSNQ